MIVDTILKMAEKLPPQIEKIELKYNQELHRLEDLIQEKIGFNLLDEYRTLIKDYEVEVQLQVYQQGFKDAFKLFKELE